MLAKLVSKPPAPDGWSFELKFDGYRALAVKHGRDVTLYSRNKKEFNDRFPEIRDAVAALEPHTAILDGEIVAVDKEGRSSFQLLQGAQPGSEEAPILFYVFDLLRIEEEPLLDRPLEERRRRLSELLGSRSDLVRFSADLGHDPSALLKAVRERGLEGIMAKRTGSRYESGQRTGAWIKLKCVMEQEFVIAGFTPPEGSRDHFGALLVGYYEDRKLRFAGKVGTGFTQKLLRELASRFRGLVRTDCPFANLPEKKAGRWSQNITPGDMKKMTWLEPQLVCQVRFTEWTADGKLRHPSFDGLREDKAPTEVSRETA